MKRLLNILTILLGFAIVPLIGLAFFQRFIEKIVSASGTPYLYLFMLSAGIITLTLGIDLLNRVKIYRQYLLSAELEKEAFWIEKYPSERMGFIRILLVLVLIIALFLGGLVIYKMGVPAQLKGTDWVLWSIELLTIALGIITVFLLNAVYSIQNGSLVILGSNSFVQKRDNKSFEWLRRWLQIKPTSLDAEVDLKHDFDGISELDNPAPPWFMWLFYSTIVFGIIYMTTYSWLKMAPDQQTEYLHSEKEIKLKAVQYLAKQADNVDEKSVVIIKDKNKLNEAAQLFSQKCATCHGQLAGGGTGPNLTDDYWLHGNSVKEVFSTIKNGVQGKAMIPWKDQLPPSKIAALASYVLSLQGTNPANASKPEGIKLDIKEKP